MPTLDSVDPSILYAMFKGEPGTRKSTQALSFPLPQFWFSWDRKMSGILIPAHKWGIDLRQVEYEDYDDWSKPAKKLEQLQVNCKYKTLIFDSLTSQCDMSLRQTITAKAGQKRSSGATAGKTIAGIAVNELEDYNAESAALQELIALTKDICAYHHVNIVLVAHVTVAEYRNTSNQTTHVSRTIVTAAKKLANKIPAYCGEVYHFNIKKGFAEGAGGEYSLLTEHTGDDFARSALDLPREIVFGEEQLYEKWLKPAIEKMKPTKLETKVETNSFAVKEIK